MDGVGFEPEAHQNGFDAQYLSLIHICNQQLLLKEESHFDKVIDPAAGSYYIENLTVSIAKQAWDLLLTVEELSLIHI